jgi:hypothetical protein
MGGRLANAEDGRLDVGVCQPDVKAGQSDVDAAQLLRSTAS